MKTTADERVDEAREYVGQAVANLSTVVVGKVDGWRLYQEEYKLVLTKALTKLIEVSSLLD